VSKPKPSETNCTELATGYWGGIPFDATRYVDESAFFNAETGGFNFVDTHRLVRVETDGDSACYWDGFLCQPGPIFPCTLPYCGCQIYYPPFDGNEVTCEFINDWLFIFESNVCSDSYKIFEYENPPFVWHMQRYVGHFAIWNTGPSLSNEIHTSTFYGRIDLDDCGKLSGTVLANELIFGEDVRVINASLSLIPVATGGSILIS